jgi:S-adenosyl methyltransferase
VGGTPQEQARNRGIDTSRPHPARRYNYWLGGKDHFQADRDSAAMIEQMMPSVSVAAKEGRKFHGRAVRYRAQGRPVQPVLARGW